MDIAAYASHGNDILVDLLNRIIGSAKDIIFLVDKDLCIPFSNCASEKFVKSSGRRESLGDPDCLEIQRLVMKPAEKVFRSGKPLSIELCFSKGDQDIRLHTVLTPITDESGKTSSVLGIARNVSEIKQEHKSLEDSGPEWSQAVHSMRHLLAIIDSHGRIKKVNKALALHLGMSQEDLVDRICHEVFGTKCPPESCPLQGPDSSSENAADFQIDILGHLFSATVTPFTDGSGKTKGCLFMARTMEERPDSLRAKKENQEKMKLLLQRSQYTVRIQDRDGKYLSITTLPDNSEMPQSFIGKTPFDFFDEDLALKICKRIRRTLDTGKTLHILSEITNRRRKALFS